jgi:hypothetical protein
MQEREELDPSQEDEEDVHPGTAQRRPGGGPQGERRDLTSEMETRPLGDLLDQVEDTARSGDRVSVEMILKAVGRRSFGPMLLLVGLVTLAPLIGDIPGVPTLMGVSLLLTAGQLLVGREQIWLPQWILSRSVSPEKLCKAIKAIRKPSRFVDRWLKPRLEPMIRGVGFYFVATVCVLIAALMPFMELIPFSANGAGIALTAFGLAVLARDGLLALVALVVILGTFGFVAYQFL